MEKEARSPGQVGQALKFFQSQEVNKDDQGQSWKVVWASFQCFFFFFSQHSLAPLPSLTNTSYIFLQYLITEGSLMEPLSLQIIFPATVLFLFLVLFKFKTDLNPSVRMNPYWDLER